MAGFIDLPEELLVLIFEYVTKDMWLSSEYPPQPFQLRLVNSESLILSVSSTRVSESIEDLRRKRPQSSLSLR